METNSNSMNATNEIDINKSNQWEILLEYLNSNCSYDLLTKLNFLQNVECNDLIDENLIFENLTACKLTEFSITAENIERKRDCQPKIVPKFECIRKYCDSQREEDKSIGQQLFELINSKLLKNEGEVKRILKSRPTDVESNWLESLTQIVMKDSTDEKKEKDIKNKIWNYPKEFCKLFKPKTSSNILDICKDLLDVYKLFISYYEKFNENDCEGFLDFIIMAFPKVKVELIIKHLDLKENMSLQTLIAKLEKQIKIKSSNYRYRQSKFYKHNSCFRFLYEVIISKVGTPQDIIQSDVKRLVESFKKEYEDSN